MTLPFKEDNGEEWRRQQQLKRRKEMRSRRRWSTAGDLATVGGCLAFFAFWLVCALMPLALMATAIYWLLTH